MNRHRYIWVGAASSVFLLYWSTPLFTQAQIVPDTVQDSTNSSVDRQGDTIRISGGVQAGRNLFHSFEEFSIAENETASFVEVDQAVRNIISRVTGSSRSDILGTINAGKNAPEFNLFLLNPNGVLFGPNARLDIKGSFVATTANAFQFGEQGFFGANASSDVTVLTVNPSALLFSQLQAGSDITIQSFQEDLELPDGRPLIRPGIEVKPEKSLAFVGGEVRLEGGELSAPGGQVTLGGLAQTGTVLLNVQQNNLSLIFPDDAMLANVILSETLRSMASVDVASSRGGSIIVHANNVDMTGSLLSAGIAENSGSNTSRSGDILINARNHISLTRSGIFNDVQEQAEGRGGDIVITATSLDLTESSLSASVALVGKGSAGDISVDADQSVSLFNSEIASAVASGAEGNGGNIEVQARSLSLEAGSQILSAIIGPFVSPVFGPLSGGEGEGGNITINADSVAITGFNTNSNPPETVGVPSGIFTSTEREASGQAGDITINTQDFLIADGASVDARTENASNGGNITINATTFEAINGGQLQTNASAEGRAGNIVVNVTDSLAVSGSDSTYQERFNSNRFGVNRVTNVGPESGLVVSSSGTGDAGNIELELTTRSGSIILGPQGKLIAQAELSDGGNISLQNLQYLVLRNGSIISASAPAGQGGDIDIEARGVIASNFEAQIDASGTVDGQITIDSPELDPDESLVELSVEVVNVDDLVARGCEAGGNLNSSTFTITGRGALTPSPTRTLSPDSVLDDLGLGVDQRYDNDSASSEPQTLNSAASQPPASKIVEARGWIREANGKLVLTAQAQAVNSYSPSLSSANCRDISSTQSSAFPSNSPSSSR